MKGIILAGGKATRLYPITITTCKQLLPIYDKPMIYYPMSVLMLAGIRDILIISTEQDIPSFQKLFKDGSQLGLKISYKVQEKPRGIAESLIIAEDFIGKDQVCLILGDNIFYGDRLIQLLAEAKSVKKGATVFAYNVHDPQRYGVVSFDSHHRALSIVEKPKKPKSHWAVTGMYFYDHQAVNIAKGLKPSARGEIEITDVNKHYLKKKQLKVKLLGRGYAWLDTGTYDSLIAASAFIKTIQDRQGLKIGCVEEIAYQQGYIKANDLIKLARTFKTSYGQYLIQRAKNEK